MRTPQHETTEMLEQKKTNSKTPVTMLDPNNDEFEWMVSVSLEN